MADGSLDVAKERLDIIDRRDVACLVNVFYDRIRADDMLGPIFDDLAHVDWPTHLPHLDDFWESVLFGTAMDVLTMPPYWSEGRVGAGMVGFVGVSREAC